MVVHEDCCATPPDLIEALATATRILVAVIEAAEPSARAVIRRRPRVQVAGPQDFASRAGRPGLGWS